MRIGMLADVYKPYISGVTNYISLTKSCLEKLGEKVYVITFGDVEYDNHEGDVIRSRGMPLVETGFYLGVHYSAEARRILRTLDIAHVHHPFISGSLALRYCKLRGIPVVFTNHSRYDRLAQAYLPILPTGVGETVLNAFLQSFCRSVDLVISPSNSMRWILHEFGVDVPIEVVPNGVDLSSYRRGIVPISRQQLHFQPDDVVLCYVGRLGPEKNLPFLLRAFGGVAQAYEHVKLLIVGGGQEQENLEDRVKYMELDNKVQFTGMVSYEIIPSYLATADVFVTASVSETFGLSVIEAMACGLPVLGIHSPGISDIVEEGHTGLLSPEDIAAFTAKMVRMVTNHGQRRAMGDNARQASENYAIERTTQILLDHYRRLVKQAANRKRGVRAVINRFVERWRK
ncbi:MAG: glycosyltransferase [Chloroflexota bacterium]